MTRAKLQLFLPATIFIISSMLLIKLLVTPPINRDEVSTYSGKLLSIECKVYNKTQYIESFIIYSNSNDPLLEYLPHSLSKECSKILTYGGRDVLIS